MAAMNRSETGAGGANPGANLNLDDDSLFAELDSEVMAGGEPGGGGLDFDLDLGGDGAPAAEAADDLDLDMGGDSLPGGDDLDLDLGGDSAGGSGGAGDELDLDLGGGGDAGMGDMDLDLGDTAPALDEAAPADDAMGGLDLELGGGGGDAGMGDMDLDLGGAEAAPGDDLDLDLGAPAAAGGEPDLDLDLDLDASPELEPLAEENLEMPAADLGDMDLELAPMGEESAGGGMESMDLMLDEPAMEAAPALGGGAGDDELGLDSLSLEPLDLPDEPVFDMAAGPEERAEAPGADAEFHAAPDVPLDDEAVSLELQDVDMEPIDDEAYPGDDMIALEPAMRADNALDLGPMAAAPTAMGAEAADEFVAVPNATLEDEDLLELNLDDLDAVPAAEVAPMMQTQSQAARQAPVAMDKTIPPIEQLEIPPDTAAMDFPPMEPMPDFDDIDAMAAAPMMSEMASPMAMPRSMPASQPAAAAQAPAQLGGSLLGNDILMAVSHQISVQLGSLSLNGKELMDISYGSVLPLERVIGEPVDLVLENKTIAQAEVVLINGKNLGVRIVALNR